MQLLLFIGEVREIREIMIFWRKPLDDSSFYF